MPASRLIPVQYPDSLWGYLSCTRTGSNKFEFSPAVGAKFRDAFPFSPDDLALVQYDQRDLSDAATERMGQRRADVFGGTIPLETKWGYIGQSGDLVISTLFSAANAFFGGRACVRTGVHYGFIGRTGEFEIAPSFENAKPFSSGYAPVSSIIGDDELWGMIDWDGVQVVGMKYRSLGQMSEGMVAFTDSNGHCGYLNSLFRVAIAPRFEMAGRFREWVAAVSEGGFWGFINNLGDYVIEPQYDNAYPFRDGLARVCLDGQWGYIDKSNEIIIPFEFDDCTDFSGGVAGVQMGDRWAFIGRDSSGKDGLLTDPSYIRIRK
ncbi:MAG: WG repeat-containing protein [Planctomycetes bacterium]|nr:WG repeat-containing protein [Planctomycetota bacterium]